MPVYLIRAGENGPVKIGHSHDPEMRLGQLQISHWETLRLIRLFDGAEAEEAALHLRFADLHIRGEWHHFSRAMMGDVGLAEVPLPSDDAVDICEEVKAQPLLSVTWDGFSERARALRKACRLTQREASELLSISRPSLAMIETNRDLPGRDVLVKMARLYGVQLLNSAADNSTDAAKAERAA